MSDSLGGFVLVLYSKRGKLQAVSLFRDSVSSGSRKDGARFHLQANCGGFDFF